VTKPRPPPTIAPMLQAIEDAGDSYAAEHVLALPSLVVKSIPFF
jgi:hypothetical protein